ncbi:MAG TPA: hypothetical protein VGG62_04125 [Terracidiphilus sp.]
MKMQESRAQWLSKPWSYLRENGSYVFLSEVANRPFHLLRNWMLARMLGVRRINIGPRAHLRGLSCMALGEDFTAGDGLWLEAVMRYRNERYSPKVVIGNQVHVSNWCHIACTNSIIIGDQVLIGSKVIITDHNHGIFGPGATSPTIPPVLRPLDSDGFVRIEANVWLGDGVVVCPRVTMGEGSVAGANAVVTADVPPFTLVAGVPARPIRRYDPDLKLWVQV